MKYHFIGIGGIGISGLAKYMHYRGHQVSGSDIRASHIKHKLEDEGLHVTIPQCAQNITDPDVVIHSAIIKSDNPEVVAAKERGIRVIPRREALLEILRDAKVYAVAGAHGKSTTSAILSELMHGSAIIGAESKAFGSNVRYCNESDVLIFEADESDGSFLNANAYCAIVTNAEPEHMEYYGHDEVLFYGSYQQFIQSAPLRILNAEDPFLGSLTCNAVRLYPSKDIRNIEYVLIKDEPYTRFELLDLGIFEVWGFGAHIALDAALAIFAAMQSVEIETIRTRLLDYKGIKKRFDLVGDSDSCIIIDDYGHHPTEIKATMEAVKTFAALRGFERITAIWQPHKYSRTVDNLEAFRGCFEGADHLIILPVWAAGEALCDIDFEGAFGHYDLLLAERVLRRGCTLEVYKDATMAQSLETGLIVGFGAGDITYQLRGE